MRTHRDLEAMQREVRRGRFRLVHLGGVVCATVIVVVGALGGPAALVPATAVASSILTLVARDVARRR